MKRFFFLMSSALIISGATLFFKRSYGSLESAKSFAQKVLASADIKIINPRNSEALKNARPWDMIVHNEKLYERVINEGSMGLGEAYMDGWWDSPHLDEFFFRVFRSEAYKKIEPNWSDVLDLVAIKVFNYQTKARAFQVGEQHYDLGNDLFKVMLDKRLIYSCAYWKDATDLDKAQENKIDLICKKLYLKPGMKVLDIGCGWGGFALYAAEKYGVEVVGVTVSKEQIAYANALKGNLPVTFLLKDYRDIDDTFDRVVSVGMFEHVGYKNYNEFMSVVHRSLKDDGLCLLHTIGGNITSYSADPWISKYIFPNGILPSLQQIAQASEPYFVTEDVHNFGAYYDPTLMAWHKNFNDHWDELSHRYSKRFKRMWNYYLLSCAGLFRARGIQLYQVVFSKQGILCGYNSVR